ncbi:60s ribosomal export protein [Nannochloropsis oceanica]
MEATEIPLTRTAARVLCPLCGLSMESNAANRCGNCVRSEINLQADVAPVGPLIQCKGCFKWRTKSKHWVAADLESRELLTLVLKFLPGLQKGGGTGGEAGGGAGGGGMEVVEAGWIWTEPHSKRLRVKLTVRKEVLNGITVQQRVQAEFVVRTMQCEACALTFTEQTWKAVCQVRQRVEHKRTFFFLEQLLLARRMESKVLDIELVKDGLDLYFSDKNTAVQFLSFLQAVVPMRTKTSRKLVSEDRQNNVHRSQWSMAVEIVPLCKDDLVLLLRGGGGREGGTGGGLQGFVLVSRVTSVVHLLDVSTLKRAEMSATRYFQRPLECVMTSKDLISYEVLDVDLVGGREGGRGGGGEGQQQQQQQQQAAAKWGLAEVEVVKTSDFGVRDVSYRVMTHLGHVLQVGDTVLGYDLVNATALGGREEELQGLRYDPPDVVLVKKVDVEGKSAKKEKKRLKRLRSRRAARAAGKEEVRRKEREREKREGRREGGGEDEGEEAEFLAFAAELEEDFDMQALLSQQENEAKRWLGEKEEGEDDVDKGGGRDHEEDFEEEG